MCCCCCCASFVYRAFKYNLRVQFLNDKSTTKTRHWCGQFTEQTSVHSAHTHAAVRLIAFREIPLLFHRKKKFISKMPEEVSLTSNHTHTQPNRNNEIELTKRKKNLLLIHYFGIGFLPVCLCRIAVCIGIRVLLPPLLVVRLPYCIYGSVGHIHLLIWLAHWQKAIKMIKPQYRAIIVCVCVTRKYTFFLK